MHFSGGASLAIDARDSQVRETDENIRTLFEALQSTGRLEHTIGVIVSDHAVEWKITERVPLMIRFPNRALTGRVAANVQLADVAPTILSYVGSDAPQWMDGLSLLEPATLPAARRIFGVSDVTAFNGPTGFRMLRDSGAPNYGVSSVMMVTGSQWFEINLSSGDLESGRVRGHTDTNALAMPEIDARRFLREQIRSAGFEFEQPEARGSAAP
jgi:hypothetical protein